MCPYLAQEVVVPFRNKKYFFCKLELRESKELHGVEERLRIDQKTLMQLCFQPQEFILTHCEKIKSLV